MKKILSNTMLLVAGVLSMASCSEDRDSNPTLIQPTEFHLNTPAVANAVVDLGLTNGVDLSWSQPVYTEGNAPVVATYYVQVSSTGSFSKEYNTNAKDEAENEGADFITLDETTTSCKTSVAGATLAKALQQLNNWEEDAVPASVEMNIRLKSAVLDAGLNSFNEVLSNVVKLNVAPYYFELKDATPIMWYLVGNMFGGKWGSDIGATALPMFLKPDYDYDKKTGEGEIDFTNYFITGEYDGVESGTAGFKIQPADFNWDFGMTGDNGKKGTIIYRNGGGDGGHIVAPEDGYYTVTMNTKDKTATMTKYEGDVKNYSSVALSGSFNGWDRTEMLPYNNEGVENHAWYLVIDATPETASERGNCELKFRTDDDWLGYGANDGDFYASGVAGSGANVGLPIGFKYVVSFNDITKVFSIQVLQ